MPVTVAVNNMSVVHAGSNGMGTFMPDVCLTPAPPSPSPIPIPYPNIAMSSDLASGSTSVKMDGSSIAIEGSNFSTSTGDEAGSAGGVASGVTKGKAEFVNQSMDVKADGKGVCRMMDMMTGNSKNTPPMPEMQAPVVNIPVEPPKPGDWSIGGAG
jgi:hypothetical protein